MDAMTLILTLALVTLGSGLAWALYQRRAAARAQDRHATSSLAHRERDGHDRGE